MAITETEASVASQSMGPARVKRKRLRWIARTGSMLLLVVCIGSVLLRLTVRDRVPLLAMWFYATPLPLVTVLGFAAVILALVGHCRKRAGVALLVGVVCGFWTYETSFVSSPAAADSGRTTRVLLWNVSWGMAGWEALAERVRAYDADVIVLSEASGKQRDMAPFWRSQFRDYNVQEGVHALIVMTRKPIGLATIDNGVLGSTGRYAVYRITLGSRPLYVVQGDIRSVPWWPRQTPIGEMIALARARANDPVLMMGDFNTPTDSAWFDGVRGDFVEAFESAGDGYAPTWPVPLPVLCIDQIWANRAVRIQDCRHEWTRLSDHKLVVAAITFAP